MSFCPARVQSAETDEACDLRALDLNGIQCRGSLLEEGTLPAPVRIAIIGDFNPEYVSHATNAPALEHAAASLDIPVEVSWVGTDTISADSPGAALSGFDGFWIAAGSPYKSRPGALAAIRFAREGKRPVLGTCAGFQYGLLEFAHNVLGRTDLEHGEDAPNAPKLLISAVACPVPGQAEGAPKLSGRAARQHSRESRARRWAPIARRSN